MLTLISSFILLTGVIWMLLIDPIIAIIAGSIFGFFYLVTGLVSRHSLRKNSKCIAHGHPCDKVPAGRLGGIRDVLIDGTQDIFAQFTVALTSPYRAQRAIRFLAPALDSSWKC